MHESRDILWEPADHLSERHGQENLQLSMNILRLSAIDAIEMGCKALKVSKLATFYRCYSSRYVRESTRLPEVALKYKTNITKAFFSGIGFITIR